MTGSILRRLLAPLAALLPGLACAAGFQYYVAPLQGITGISQSAIGSAAPGPKYGGMIDPKYADRIFTPTAQKSLIEQFNREIAAAFPTAVIGPNQIVAAGRSGKYAFEPFAVAQCSPSFRVGYRDVFATSIGISRLSVYINDYSGFTQVLIPVTYTVRFIKMLGASITFAKSETIYTQFTTTTQDFYAPGTREIAPANLAKINEALLADASKVVSQLVGSAVRNFQPKQTQVNLVGRDGPYFVFDRGSEIGFESGTEVYAEDEAGKEYGFVVKYATDRLAVAVASVFSKEVTEATNRLREGAKLNFSFDRPGRDDAKVSVLAVSYQPTAGAELSPDRVLSNALQSILVDDLGFSAPFNIIKQDPDFVLLKGQIRAEANCAADMYREMPGFADTSTTLRPTPDLFLKVDFARSPVLRASGVGGMTTNDSFQTAVTLSLVDASGVVRQSVVGTADYELKRTSGKGLSVEQASEVNLKNAGLAALKNLLSNFAPRQRTVPITAVDASGITLAAPMSPTTVARARLVRPLRVAKLNNRTVLLPVPRSGLDATVIERPTGMTEKLAFRGQPPKPTDLLLVSGAGEANAVRACPPERSGRHLQHPALRHPSGFDRLMPSVLGASLKNYEFFESDTAYLGSAERALTEGYFEAAKLSEPVPTAFCFLALEVQNLPKIECAAGKCNGSASVGSGARIFNANARVADSTVGGSVDFKDVAESEVSAFVGLKAFEQHVKMLETHRSKVQ